MSANADSRDRYQHPDRKHRVSAGPNGSGEISGYEETPYSARLFRDLAMLQSRAQFGLDEIDIFAVAAGPGSFTGLRVGLTAVKAWAEVHVKPIAAISGLEAIAAQAKATEHGAEAGREIIAPFLDARRGQVFGSTYARSAGNSSSLKIVGYESILSIDEFLEHVKRASGQALPVFVSPTPDIIPAGRADTIFPGVRIEPVSGILAPVIGQLGFDRASRGDLVDALHLDANYVRRSDAEAAWKDG